MYYVSINAPVICLTFHRLQSLVVGRKTNIQNKTSKGNLVLVVDQNMFPCVKKATANISY